MRTTSTDLYFTAILQDENGNPLAKGNASVFTKSGYVDFFSDFVPLYPIGTKLKIIRMQGNMALHEFCGELYFCNKKQLRLTSVKDFLYKNSQNIYTLNLSVQATLTPPNSPEKDKFRFPWQKPPQPTSFPCKVQSITHNVLEFTCAETFLQGDILKFRAEPPWPIKHTLTLEIEKVYAFSSEVGYVASLQHLHCGENEALEAFRADLNRQQNQLFEFCSES